MVAGRRSCWDRLLRLRCLPQTSGQLLLVGSWELVAFPVGSLGGTWLLGIGGVSMFSGVALATVFCDSPDGSRKQVPRNRGVSRFLAK